MTPSIQQAILNFTGATQFEQESVIQSLWSGYGEILRLRCKGVSSAETVIAKYVSLPDTANHPRGWNTNISHQRKVCSYQVECHWYQQFAEQCDDICRVPGCFGTLEDGQEFVMVLEDLDAAGFPVRVKDPQDQDIALCIRWLANFHAKFLGEHKAEGLWPVGTYWHLSTRPDELAVLADGDLKTFAAQIDSRLSNCKWQTLVHGDAKLANFCFSINRKQVAAVDFQYVGGGCGMKDLAYFISSCLSEDECEQYESDILDLYFSELQSAVKRLEKRVPFEEIEKEWRDLYPVSWTDFYRFLQGWSPGHWKIHAYSEKIAKQTIAKLKASR